MINGQIMGLSPGIFTNFAGLVPKLGSRYYRECKLEATINIFKRQLDRCASAKILKSVSILRLCSFMDSFGITKHVLKQQQ